MSAIDERIVEMKFKNEDFQRKSADTLRALQDLKKGTDFSGASRGLQELQSVGNGFHLNGMSSAVDGMVGRFTALQTAGIAALAAIGATALTVGLGMARDLVMTQPLEGLKEYETQINAIQTIQANTAASGTTLDDINGALSELNDYADMTIYNFGEMARSIGTFTAKGIDLDTSVAAIKGLANVAAMAGSNSQQAATAMYQLSQAMGSGTVRLQDWMSIENASMDTQAFKDSLLETARAQGVAVDAMIEKNGSFRASLSENWLTADIMTATLNKFTGDMTDAQLAAMGYTAEQIADIQSLAQTATDSAQKVKTFTQLMGTLAEATASGWARSWQIVLGDFEEAKALFTEMSDLFGGMIGDSADARNAQLEIWKAGGGREAIIQSLRNSLDAVLAVLRPIGEAFAEVFPPNLGNTLLDISFALRDFTNGLVIGADKSETIRKVFIKVFEALKGGLDILGTGLGVFFSFLGSAFEIVGAVFALLGPLVDWFANLGDEAETGGDGIGDFADELVRIKDIVVGGLLTALEFLQEVIQKLIDGDYSGIGAMFDGALQPIVDLGLRIRDVWGGIMTWFGDVFGVMGDHISDSFNGVFDSVNNIGDFIKNLAEGFTEFFSGFGDAWDELMANIDPTAVLAAMNAGVLTGIIIGIMDFLKNGSSLKDSMIGVIDGIADALEGITGVLEGMESRIKADALLRIAAAIAILAIALLIMSQIDPDKLVGSVTALSTAFAIMMGAMLAMDKIASGKGIARMPFIAASMLILSFAINILSLAILRLSGMSWEELAKGLGAVAVAIGLLLVAAEVMKRQEEDMVRAAAALIIFSIALYALTGVIAILGTMPMDVLAQGMIAVSIMIALLVSSAMLLGAQQGNMMKASVGMIAMSAALGMLAAVIILMGMIPLEVLQQGLAVTGIMLLGLVTAAAIIGQLAPKIVGAAGALMAMAGALLLLTIPILIFGNMDLAVLAQGMGAVAIMLAVLVAAANSMKTAITGAGAMVVMAVSLLLIAAAIKVLAGIPIEAVGVALLAIAGVFAILAITGAIIGPLLGPLAGLAAIIVILSIAFGIFALSMMVLGPALVILTGSLLLFSEVAEQIASAIPAMIGIGLALIVFGAGAAVAGAGAIILGAGLVLMGAGLALLATFGMLGIYVLVQLVENLGALSEHIPAMLGFGAALLVLGIGLAVVGVAMALLGIGVLALGVGLAILTAVGAAAVPVIILLFQTMISLIPPAIEAFGMGLTMLIELMRTKIPEFIVLGTELIMGFLAAIQEVVPEIIDTVLVMIQSLIDGIVEAVPMFVDGGMRLITGILEGIADNIESMAAAATDVVVKFLEAIGENLPDVVEAGFEMVIEFIEGITDSVRRNADRVSDAGWDLAEAIIQGMVNGIGEGVNRVWTAAQNMAQTALQGAMDFLNINSPSRLFRDKVGKPIPEGTALGIRQEEGQVVDSVTHMGQVALNAMQQAMSDMETAAHMETDIQPTIRPVLDLSEVRNGARTIGGLMPAPAISTEATSARAQAIIDEKIAQLERQFEDRSEPVQKILELKYEQNITAPDALDEEEIYRNTNNGMSRLKGALEEAYDQLH